MPKLAVTSLDTPYILYMPLSRHALQTKISIISCSESAYTQNAELDTVLLVHIVLI